MAASESSSDVLPQPNGVPEASATPPIAHPPKPMALTRMPVRPSSRYCMFGFDCRTGGARFLAPVSLSRSADRSSALREELQANEPDLFHGVDRLQCHERL